MGTRLKAVRSTLNLTNSMTIRAMSASPSTSPFSSITRARPRPSTARTRLGIGPAMATNIMSLAGLRRLDSTTGTGFAPAEDHRRRPQDRREHEPAARQRDGHDRVDVRERVDREPTFIRAVVSPRQVATGVRPLVETQGDSEGHDLSAIPIQISSFTGVPPSARSSQRNVGRQRPARPSPCGACSASPGPYNGALRPAPFGHPPGAPPPDPRASMTQEERLSPAARGALVLRLESEAIARLGERFVETGPAAAFERAVAAMLACSGQVVVTGMGKAGVVGQKVSATWRARARRPSSSTPPRRSTATWAGCDRGTWSSPCRTLARPGRSTRSWRPAASWATR